MSESAQDERCPNCQPLKPGVIRVDDEGCCVECGRDLESIADAQAEEKRWRERQVERICHMTAAYQHLLEADSNLCGLVADGIVQCAERLVRLENERAEDER